MSARRAAPLLLLTATLLLPAVATEARDYGIFVDGSYSPGEEDTPMDELVDRRLDDARRVFDQRHPDGASSRAGSREELRETLQGIRCGCDDSITVVLMGHGQEDRFTFSKARRSRDRRLRAGDLADWLEEAAVECCCEIHVVIFSCHSGSFLDDLFEKPHVESVWASSREDEQSYTDAHWLSAPGEEPRLLDDGDWMRGFVEDWRDAPRGASPGDALEESAESAEEKMPERFTPVQHPQGWRRGDGEVLAHVESRSSRSLRLHYFEPEFLRSTTDRVDVSEVGQPEERLRRCDWVRFPARFGEPGEVEAAGDVERADPPRQRVLAHFAGMRSGKAIFHTVRPKWQYCEHQRLVLGDPSHEPQEELSRCSWIDQELEIVDPEKTLRTTAPLTRASPTVRVKVHVSGARNLERGTFRAHLLEPPWLRCDDVDVRPPGGRQTVRELATCSNLVLDLALRPVDRHGTLQGSNLRRVYDGVGRWGGARDVAVNRPSPVRYSLSAHPGARTLQPSVAVTNVGTETVTVPVRGALGPAEESTAWEAWLAGEPDAAEPPWSGQAVIEDLQPGDTARVELGEWSAPPRGGDFRVAFRSRLPDDANPASDASQLDFRVPVLLPDGGEEPFDGLDLGTLAPGLYDLPVTARNVNCAGRHDFRIYFHESAEEESPAPWLRLPERPVLKNIRPGGTKDLTAVVDLAGLSPGRTLRGTLRIECLTCPPTCQQDVTEVAVRVTVGAGAQVTPRQR